MGKLFMLLFTIGMALLLIGATFCFQCTIGSYPLIDYALVILAISIVTIGIEWVIND